MRKIKIITDSSSDVLYMEGVDFASAPLKIITDSREFVDNESLNVDEMVEYLEGYKGKSRSSCPNTGDWLEAFGDAEEIFCLTITSGLSGSYNSACAAKQIYEDEYEDRRVYVIDSLSTGPEMRLMLEKLRECIDADKSFEEICSEVGEYKKRTGLFFILRSIKNLANNGRVSPVLAKIVGIAGIRIIGKASEEGTLEQTDKCRGEEHSLKKLLENLLEVGFSGGKVRIAHCQNEEGAQKLKALIKEKFRQVQIEISECRGLCSFYAERGGLLIGYERG